MPALRGTRCRLHISLTAQLGNPFMGMQSIWMFLLEPLLTKSLPFTLNTLLFMSESFLMLRLTAALSSTIGACLSALLIRLASMLTLSLGYAQPGWQFFDSTQ